MSILALTANTLAGSPGAGQLEYDGQYYATDSNSSRGQLERLVQGTAVASTSGTSIDFTGIPAWVKRITVMFNGVSTSGISNVQVQLGTSGGIVTSGYLSTASNIAAATSATTNVTTGLFIYSNTATDVRSGHMVITNLSGNLWVSSCVVKAATNQMSWGAGDVTLSGVLTQVRITTVGGTDTFDAGSINIMYEG